MGLVIVDTGVANSASLACAFERLGVRPLLSDEPREVESADALVLPGVGAFGHAMERLATRGLASIIRERIEQDRPTLAICLGMQLLCEESDESPGIRGIAALASRVERLGGGRVRLPQFGFNRVDCDATCRLLQGGYAYFANSFALRSRPPGFACAVTSYGEGFISALERGKVLACQFHPELSGAWGASLLSRWLARAGLEACPC